MLIYRKNPNISLGLIQRDKHFLVILYTGELVNRTAFVSGVFHTCYCISRIKQNGIKQKNNAPSAKCYFITRQQTNHAMSFTIRDH